MFDLKLTSPESEEPCTAVGPEMNAQYLNIDYLVLSLHPVDAPCQHNHTHKRRGEKQHKCNLTLHSSSEMHGSYTTYHKPVFKIFFFSEELTIDSFISMLATLFNHDFSKIVNGQLLNPLILNHNMQVVI